MFIKSKVIQIDATNLGIWQKPLSTGKMFQFCCIVTASMLSFYDYDYLANVLNSKKKQAHRNRFLGLYTGPVIYVTSLGSNLVSRIVSMLFTDIFF